MPHALALAWRLLLAVALVASPIAGLASGDACAQRAPVAARAAAAPAHATVATNMAVAMPGCTHMADMAPVAPKAPQGKPVRSSPVAPGHGGCTSNACCLGGAVAMTGLALGLDALPSRHSRPDMHDAALPQPPSSRMLRPPIA